MKPITVGITTRNRPAALERAVLSLRCATDLFAEAIVFDDASDPAADAALATRTLGVPTRVIRDERAPGPIFARNRLVETASTRYVLLLDDDAELLSRESIQAGLNVLESDLRVAAVAFAQAEADGSPWPLSMQPAPCATAAVVRSFIGFAHLVRREAFREAGGYQELFGFYGEEKEFCLRLWARGSYVVYLPGALVIHACDPSGRDPRRYLRQVTRNDVLASLLTDPWPRPLWVVPGRLALYFRMRRAWRISDPGGFAWLLRDLCRTLPRVVRSRRPVSWQTLRQWHSLGTDGRPYPTRQGAVV